MNGRYGGLHFVSWSFGVLHLLVDHLFRTSGFVRLEALVFAGNPASERVLERAGFTREATRRTSIYKAGRFLDSHLYARLRDAP